jgi:hypothetical protein
MSPTKNLAPIVCMTLNALVVHATTGALRILFADVDARRRMRGEE